VPPCSYYYHEQRADFSDLLAGGHFEQLSATTQSNVGEVGSTQSRGLTRDGDVVITPAYSPPVDVVAANIIRRRRRRFSQHFTSHQRPLTSHYLAPTALTRVPLSPPCVLRPCSQRISTKRRACAVRTTGVGFRFYSCASAVCATLPFRYYVVSEDA